MIDVTPRPIIDFTRKVVYSHDCSFRKCSIAFRFKSTNSDNSRTGVCSMINGMKINVTYFDSQHLWTKHIFDRSWDRQTDTSTVTVECVITDYWPCRMSAAESVHDTSIVDSCFNRVLVSRCVSFFSRLTKNQDVTNASFDYSEHIKVNVG